MAGATALHAHLGSGSGTVCRAWTVKRPDGVILGFTDHDVDLAYDNVTFKAETGLSARALQQATGLSVDNTEAMGALSASAIREEDIAAGRYDGAEVTAWLVNWADVSARRIMFRGHIGEVRRGAGAFYAELRGLTEALNRPVGRVFQKPCTAVLGDRACGFDTTLPGHTFSGALETALDGRVFSAGPLDGYELGWFQRGLLRIESGAAAGLSGAIKRDRLDRTGTRVLELWEPLRAAVEAGDAITLVAGCDKRFATCRLKFNNAVNFQGFPDVPEEDWVMVHPSSAKSLSGGSRR